MQRRLARIRGGTSAREGPNVVELSSPWGAPGTSSDADTNGDGERTGASSGGLPPIVAGHGKPESVMAPAVSPIPAALARAAMPAAGGSGRGTNGRVNVGQDGHLRRHRMGPEKSTAENISSAASRQVTRTNIVQRASEGLRDVVRDGRIRECAHLVPQYVLCYLEMQQKRN